MMHVARELCGGQICVTPDAAPFADPETGGWMEKYYTINDDWVADDRRKLLAFARDLINSDYAGHRLTFQLFAQSPPFAHLRGGLPQLRLRRPARLRAARGRALRARAARGGERAMTAPSPDPAVQHARHLSRAGARQRPLPGGGGRGHGLPARPGRAGPRHVGVGGASATSSARPSRRWRTSSCCCARPARARPHRQGDRDLPDRHPLPRAGLPRDRARLQGVLPGLDRDRGDGARAARVAGRDRRDRRDPAMTLSLLGADPGTGEVGIAIASSSAGGGRAVRVRAGRGRRGGVAERDRSAARPGAARRARPAGRRRRSRRSARWRRRGAPPARGARRRAGAARCGRARGRSASTAAWSATRVWPPATCWPPSPCPRRRRRRSPPRPAASPSACSRACARASMPAARPGPLHPPACSWRAPCPGRRSTCAWTGARPPARRPARALGALYGPQRADYGAVVDREVLAVRPFGRAAGCRVALAVGAQCRR